MTGPEQSISLFLATEADTFRLGKELALALKAGDCLALSGDLGAGKSTLARALLRAVADDPTLEVPSPTFTLVQTYALRLSISHFDFYRLTDASELDELGFDEALATGICLVEWPERAENALPADRIRLTLRHDGDGRRATIHARPPQAERIARTLAIRQFLRDHGHGDAHRRYLSGDASVRAYETITAPNGGRTILMDWPLPPESPPVLDGKPYPKVAHIAEDAYPFVALAGHLRERGFSAPDVYHADYNQGILLIEDLGHEGILDLEGRPIAERYRESVLCLARLHKQPATREIPVSRDAPGNGVHIHRIPDFDRVAMTMEVRLLLDWHLPWKRGAAATETERADYLAIWDALIDQLDVAECNLLLRDFHSPNIIWRDDRTGPQRIGLIDFQDAMIGPTAYDVASIVQDARVTIEPALAERMMADYLEARRLQDNFDEETFLRSFAIMAAQRACKLCGLWVRLMQRDGKPAYMQHMPRTLDYLETTLIRDEALLPLRDWCVRVGISKTLS